MKYRKPKLSIDEQILHLQSKGVKFNDMSITDAKHYLTENNNFSNFLHTEKIILNIYPAQIKRNI